MLSHTHTRLTTLRPEELDITSSGYVFHMWMPTLWLFPSIHVLTFIILSEHKRVSFFLFCFVFLVNKFLWEDQNQDVFQKEHCGSREKCGFVLLTGVLVLSRPGLRQTPGSHKYFQTKTGLTGLNRPLFPSTHAEALGLGRPPSWCGRAYIWSRLLHNLAFLSLLRTHVIASVPLLCHLTKLLLHKHIFHLSHSLVQIRKGGK